MSQSLGILRRNSCLSLPDLNTIKSLVTTVLNLNHGERLGELALNLLALQPTQVTASNGENKMIVRKLPIAKII